MRGNNGGVVTGKGGAKENRWVRVVRYLDEAGLGKVVS